MTHGVVWTTFSIVFPLLLYERDSSQYLKKKLFCSMEESQDNL